MPAMRENEQKLKMWSAQNIQDELASAMAFYRGTEEVKSISHLTALMAGGGSSKKRCVYDNKLKIWIARRFEPLPKGDFEWECLGSGSKGTTEFVLDSGSQLNFLPMSEIRD